ncbi:DCC1-like thiol-disulfide oxidoreductase family protein [uncultured Parasphingorhabdus sp.]|uniref:DCC1-like thiol-disulfide oxidoreductase family protein n=1 Tax=uncultured Parasphingorhabdus sp. TaxID=2709694 RepID=UPI002AA64CA6|nr:DCC1-like thiol-disulfide oxidoreductase family protein [uncultured Parasphingorhabdus sp.]
MSWLVYDGDCPFCANYVELLRLREQFPDIDLVDARMNRDHDAVQKILQAGYVVDEGMALIDGDNIFYGAAAIHSLARPSSSVFGRINWWIFKSQERAGFLYPILSMGRSAVLKLLGRKKMGY